MKRDEEIIKKVRFGTVIFIASEIMLFGALISTFISVLRIYPTWPPPGLPKYPAMQTLINSIPLLISFLTNIKFREKFLIHYGIFTIVFGTLFVILQGTEWIRLIKFGLTIRTEIYGSIFYLIVGVHALHVLVGIIWYIVGIINLRKGKIEVIEGGSIFWSFVVLIWPVIYFFVFILPDFRYV